MKDDLYQKEMKSLRPAALLEKETLKQVFSSELLKFRRTPFLQNTSGPFLLPLEFQ